MNIAIAGLGGVGGYIGGKLCTLQPEHRITFIARGKHANAIRENGLEIIEDTSSFTAHPDHVTEADMVEGTFDLILLCVKSYDIASTIHALKRTITPQTIIMPVANGVEHARSVRDLVDARVIDTAVYILSHIQSPGVIRKKGKVFAIVLGNHDEPESVATVADLLEQSGLRYKTPENITEALWKKYIFIAAFANLTSFYDLSIRQVVQHHPDETERLLREIVSVARANGLELESEIEKSLATAASLPEDASTSMHLDFQNRHRTELETLSGYLVREAQRLHIAVPLLSEIYTTLKEKDHG